MRIGIGPRPFASLPLSVNEPTLGFGITMGMLLGMWDEDAAQLTIRRPTGQVYKVKGTVITSGSHKVFGVETVGNEVHVLTGPHGNRQPNRRVKFNDSGAYRGNSGV